LIVDKIGNIGIYQDLGVDLSLALSQLKEISPDRENGVYRINDRVRAIIDTYQTRIPGQARWEAHVKNIDIQYPLQGEELAEWAPLEGLAPVSEYDQEKDVRFYENSSMSTRVVLGNGTFAIFFPHDAHRPSQAVNGISRPVKKLTLKISI
jgi:YhcH/YjgK/YiaL family protein